MNAAAIKENSNNALQATYSEWQEWLVWFMRDLQSDMGDILHHLTPFLTAPRPADDGGLLTAPGLETVRRRGDYAHLLLSEWILTDAIPDEFLRRAAQNEHLFFSPPPYEEEGGRRVFALFDVGPQQLGLPRVAHLALMILLSRRASMLNGIFQWGILQQTPQWQEFSQDVHLRKLLNARNLEPTSSHMLKSWQDFFQQGDKGDECWLISSSNFYKNEDIVFISHYISIDEMAEPNTLCVNLQQKGRSPIEIMLPLPEEERSKRLLAGKFNVNEQKKKNNKEPLLNRAALLSPLTISPTGKKVMLQTRNFNGCLIEVDIKKRSPRVRRCSLPKCNQAIAAGYSMSEQLCVLFYRTNYYELWSVDKRFPKGVVELYNPENISKSNNQSQSLFPMFDHKGNGLIFRHSEDGCLTLVTHENSSKECVVLKNVKAVQSVSETQLLLLSEHDGRFRLETIEIDSLEIIYSFDIGDVFFSGDVFLYNQYLTNNIINSRIAGALIQKLNKNSLNYYSMTKRFCNDTVTTEFKLPEGSKVVGAWYDEALEIIVPILWDRKKTLGVWRGDQFENWYSSTSKLVRVEMCMFSGTIVMHDIEHQITFFDVKNCCLKARTKQEGKTAHG